MALVHQEGERLQALGQRDVDDVSGLRHEHCPLRLQAAPQLVLGQAGVGVKPGVVQALKAHGAGHLRSSPKDLTILGLCVRGLGYDSLSESARAAGARKGPKNHMPAHMSPQKNAKAKAPGRQPPPLGGAVAIVGVTAAVYLGGVAVFSNVFMPQTRLNGQDVSLMPGADAARAGRGPALLLLLPRDRRRP